MLYAYWTNKGLAQMTKKRLVQIERQIEEIKAELADMGEMRPGSLTRQYKDPETQSGPYYQLSYTLDMKSRTEYIVANLSATFAARSATTSASGS